MKKQHIKAIPTKYNQHRFRSRLEAKWAILFDELGLKWGYETEGFILPDNTPYLPDFYFPELDCYAEVKPKLFTDAEYNKAAQLDKPCLLLDEPKPTLKKFYYCTGTGKGHENDPKEWDDGTPVNQDPTSLDTYERYVSGDPYERVNIEFSKLKTRLWYEWENFDAANYIINQAPEIKANSARFEHGEQAG